MFYYYYRPVLAFHWTLILFAVIPAIFLMRKVYRSDRLERESHQILLKLVIAGILATLPARFEERIGESVLSFFLDTDSEQYSVILYFGIVAYAEETSKYFLMKRATWKDPEYNCLYDGVVYAVFTSLGFALWENIHYVLSYGLSTAIVRAVTAIPGHACFGVFMGVFYGLAKHYDVHANHSAAKAFRILAILSAATLHGAYDYIATEYYAFSSTVFLAFIAGLFLISYWLVNRMSKADHYFHR